jgi:ABC-type Fe3+ transport system permease subunit
MYQPPASTNSLARASLVLGVAEFFTMGLTAIPAIICGHMAKKEMRQTGQRGDGLATSGLVLGYMAVIFWGILIALSIVSVVITSTGAGT